MVSRYPTERLILAVTLLASALLILLTAPFTVGGTLLVVIVGFAIGAFRIAMARKNVRKQGVPVSQYPELAARVEHCRQRLGMAPGDAEVFVLNAPTLNAFAVGMGRPYTVAIYTGLIEALDLDEQTFVIGHELGHVQFRHTRILGLIGQLGTQGMGSFISLIVRRFIFLLWMRASEFTADRAGLLACGRLDKAISTQLKLAMGARWREVDIPSMVRHYQAHDAGAWGDIMKTHPGLEARVDRLVDYDRARR